jgi:hypothetical protein
MDVDCWTHVLCNLASPADVLNAALTCRAFAEITRSSTFYLAMFERHLGKDFLGRGHCVSQPLLTGLSDVPDDVDCTDPGSYFRFLWQQR